MHTSSASEISETDSDATCSAHKFSTLAHKGERNNKSDIPLRVCFCASNHPSPVYDSTQTFIVCQQRDSEIGKKRTRLCMCVRELGKKMTFTNSLQPLIRISKALTLSYLSLSLSRIPEIVFYLHPLGDLYPGTILSVWFSSFSHIYLFPVWLARTCCIVFERFVTLMVASCVVIPFFP